MTILIFLVTVIALVAGRGSSAPSSENDNLRASDDVKIPTIGLKTMPNIGFLLSGYDVMFGNPLPTLAWGVLTSDPGFRLPIFSSDFSKGQMTQDIQYVVPNACQFDYARGHANRASPPHLSNRPSSTVKN